jgi:(p)ppGpp synthase/HD superfamily hydrolase
LPDSRASGGSQCLKDGHAATRERLAETRGYSTARQPPWVVAIKWGSKTWRSNLHPDDYRRIASLAEKRGDRERYITSIACWKRCCAPQVSRPRSTAAPSIYSIHRKMGANGYLRTRFDLRAVRITVTVADCYAALGLVHGQFTYTR